MAATESSRPMQESPGTQDGTAMERIERLQEMLKQAGPQQEAPADYTKQVTGQAQSMQDPSATPDLNRLQQMLKQAGPQQEAPADYIKQMPSSPSPLTISPALKHSPAYTALTQDPQSAAPADPFQKLGGVEASSFDQRQPNSLNSIIGALKQSGCSAGADAENISCNSTQRNTPARTR